MQNITPDGEPFCMATLIRRATVRQLRLHACGCMRLSAPKRTGAALIELVEVAERYADGEVGAAELAAARKSRANLRPPKAWGGDFGWAFEENARLQDTWNPSIGENRTFRPDERDYRFALPRHRVFEELLGPDPRPDFSGSWRTDTVLALAKRMYEAREFGAMPILADALQDAGCDDEQILNHCRHAAHPHLRGCWVTDLVLGKS